MQNNFVTLKYKVITKKKYHINYTKRSCEVIENLWRALAFEAPGESFFLRIYQFESFCFSKVSKYNCDPQRQLSTAGTRLKKCRLWNQSAVNKMLSLPLWPIIFHMLFRLIGGRAEYSEAKLH